MKIKSKFFKSNSSYFSLSEYRSISKHVPRVYQCTADRIQGISSERPANAREVSPRKNINHGRVTEGGKGHTESRDNATGSDYIDVSTYVESSSFSPHHASESPPLFLLCNGSLCACASV